MHKTIGLARRALILFLCSSGLGICRGRELGTLALRRLELLAHRSKLLAQLLGLALLALEDVVGRSGSRCSSGFAFGTVALA